MEKIKLELNLDELIAFQQYLFRHMQVIQKDNKSRCVGFCLFEIYNKIYKIIPDSKPSIRKKFSITKPQAYALLDCESFCYNIYEREVMRAIRDTIDKKLI